MSKSAKDFALQHFAQRTAFDLGRRGKLSEMMTSSKDEMKSVRTISRNIADSFNKYLIEGTDVREGIKTSQASLKVAREVLTEKQKPFRAVVSPLQKAIAYLDKKSPSVLADAGIEVSAVYEVPETLKAEIDNAKAKAKKQ